MNVLMRAAFTALSILTAVMAQAQTPASATVALYASVGPELVHYRLDVDSASLIKQGSVTVPGSGQYCWPHISRPCLYVGWSNGSGANHHGVSAFRIAPKSGDVHPLGAPVALAPRPGYSPAVSPC